MPTPPRLALLHALLALALAGCPQPREAPTGLDEDGDSISDVEEGSSELRDTDRDGTPDFLDDDSDGDGLPDRLEAGDAQLETAAVDSDRDGVPDFLDLDSDDNGLLDEREGTDDVDGDGRLDFVDDDDDGDGVPDALELDPTLDTPADWDGDGLPNFRDPDSDGDDIADGDEHPLDTDGDGIADVADLDSDDDTIPDAVEAGDPDLETPPIDTDGDGRPDFRDADSDADGLPDAFEAARGSSPTAADTDADGVSDLIEHAAGTSPLDADDNPTLNGDLVFVAPFDDAVSPEVATLRWRTSINLADLYFLFDISSSMQIEIAELTDAVSSLVGDLRCEDSSNECVRDAQCSTGFCDRVSGTCGEDPSTGACVPSVWTGAGYYGASYWHRDGPRGDGIGLQPNPIATSDAMGSWVTTGATEELFAAAVGVADPGLRLDSVGCEAPAPDRRGCPGYREDAIKVLVALTDEGDDGGATLNEAARALQNAGITFIGVWAGEPTNSERDALVDLAMESGSLAADGTPLVFDGVDEAVVPAVRAAIQEVVHGAPLRVTITAEDLPDDAGDALAFIDHLAVDPDGAGCTAPGPSGAGPVEDSDGDGRDDTFGELPPGTPVCWSVTAAPNTRIAPTAEPQVFRARLTVRGDGSTLDTRVVYFLVPPAIPELD